MTEFKVGDRIRKRDGSRFGKFSLSSDPYETTVSRINKNGNYAAAAFNDVSYADRELELVSTPKFKVGDKVLFTHGVVFSANGGKTFVEGTIDMVDDFTSSFVKYRLAENGLWYGETELELTSPAADIEIGKEYKTFSGSVVKVTGVDRWKAEVIKPGPGTGAPVGEVKSYLPANLSAYNPRDEIEAELAAAKAAVKAAKKKLADFDKTV